MARKKKDKPPENTERWLTTYADLISLLMIFFVVLFATSEVQKDKLLAISESMRRSLHKENIKASSIGASLLASPTRTSTTAVSEAIKKAAKAFGIDKSVSFSTDERGTVISIVDSVFFNAGETEINNKIKPLLLEVAQFCKDTNAQIVVEGHTDNSPIKKKKLVRNNWELSTLRATNVVKFFIKEVHFKPQKISAMGYADTKPIEPNDSKENRARNRRISIVLVNNLIKTRPITGQALSALDLFERQKKIKEENIGHILNPFSEE